MSIRDEITVLMIATFGCGFVFGMLFSFWMDARFEAKWKDKRKNKGW